ncbi:MAG: AAA family ATPase [Anaerolineae bacterium]|nr:AAA family ATPase [Anaerolineae bacterium]
MSTFALQVRLFGSLELVWGSDSLSTSLSARSRSLLAYLVLHHDRPIPRDRLAGLFWPERPDSRARRALSQALWQIRSALGPAAGRLEAERRSVTFRLHSADRFDVEEFENQVEKAKGWWQKASTCIPLLASAVRLYRADLLEECYDDWALLERERLRELYLGALEQLITLHKQQSDYEQALTYAQQLVAADPLRESGHLELMRLYHLLGRPHAALTQFATLHHLLAEELGVSPASSTVALYQDIAAALGESSPPHLPVAPPPILRDLSRLPLVGREAERNLLLDALQEAMQGRCGLAIIEGEAGVGKTRLVTEVVADASWRGFQVGTSKADPMVASAPYGLLTHALLDLFTPLRLAQLAKLVEPHHWSAVAHLIPKIGEAIPDLPPLSDLPLDRQQERLWEGLARCIDGLTIAGPVLLLLEDLHWADEASLIALQHLFRWLRGSRLLVVVTYRPAEAWERPAVRETLEALDRVRSIDRIRLAPLTAGQTGLLVQRALREGEDSTFAAKLWTRTNGNPLFIIETLKTLLERGDLDRLPDDSWTFPGDESPLSIPTSVRELISGRLARLSPPLRTVLDWIAVLGEVADFDLIARVGDIIPFDLVGNLQALTRQGFLVEMEQGYRFTHDLIWEITYRAINPQRRRKLHRRAGEALEALHPDWATSLAFHFDRGGQREKALTFTLRAAKQAGEVYDYETALRHYRRALELVGDDLPMRWQVLSEQEALLYLTARREADAALLDEMLHLADSFPDPLHRAEALMLMGRHRGRWEAPRQGLSLLEEALRLARAGEEPRLLGKVMIEIAYIHWRMGNVVACQTATEEARAVFRQIGDRRLERIALNQLVSLYLGLLGDYGRALSYSRESYRIAKELGDAYGAAVDIGNVALAQALLGKYEAAQKAIGESIAFAARVGDRYAEGAFHIFEAIIWWGLGDLERAQVSAQQALEICRQSGSPNFEIEALGWLGRITLERGRVQRARQWFEQAVQLAEAHSQVQDRAEQLSHLALAYSRLGQHETALRLSDEALTTMKAEMETSDWLKLVCFEHAQIIAAARGPSAARPYLERAYRMLMDVAARIGDPDLRRSFLENVPDNRAIAMAYRLGRFPTPPRRQAVRLPAAGAPTGRPLREDEFVEVTWTVSAPEDDGTTGKTARRRQRILRLLREAAAQSAAPTVAALAEALGVSERTVKRDLSALRQAGHDVRTRGSR